MKLCYKERKNDLYLNKETISSRYICSYIISDSKFCVAFVFEKCISITFRDCVIYKRSLLTVVSTSGCRKSKQNLISMLV